MTLLKIKILTLWAMCTTYLTQKFSLFHFVAYVVGCFLSVHVYMTSFFYIYIYRPRCRVWRVLCWTDRMKKMLKFEIVTEKINRAYEVCKQENALKST